ncbi:hypothetical protein ACLFLN_17195 [Acinetobacter pittii]
MCLGKMPSLNIYCHEAELQVQIYQHNIAERILTWVSFLDARFKLIIVYIGDNIS